MVSEDLIAVKLKESVERELQRIGLLFRTFSRTKSPESIRKKLSEKAYTGEDGSRMQDLYGIRVVVYFPEDSSVAQEALKAQFEWLEESSTVDTPSMATFGPTRCNLVFRLPEEHIKISETLKREPLIDETFEVQFRTMFSEGWHEIEHDLRYKHKESWRDHPDLDRSMNGLIATLEMCDWSIEKLLDDLAYRNYKNQDWASMIRNKFRLRFGDSNIGEDVHKYFDDNPEVAKAVFRVERNELLRRILKSGVDVPLIPDNVVLLANAAFIKSTSLSALAPKPIQDELTLIK